MGRDTLRNSINITYRVTVIDNYIARQQEERLHREFNNLLEEFGFSRIALLFPSGFEGFKASRIEGNYSLDSIKQTLEQ